MAKTRGEEKVSEEGAAKLIEEPMRIAAQLLRPLGPDVASASMAQINSILNAKSSQDKLREAVDIVYNSSYNTLTAMLKMGGELAKLDDGQRAHFIETSLPRVLLANIDMAVDIARLNERYGLKMADLIEATLKASLEKETPARKKRKCPEETADLAKAKVVARAAKRKR